MIKQAFLASFIIVFVTSFSSKINTSSAEQRESEEVTTWPVEHSPVINYLKTFLSDAKILCQRTEENVLAKEKHWSLQRYYIITPQRSRINASVLTTISSPTEIMFCVEDVYYSTHELRAKTKALLEPQTPISQTEETSKPAPVAEQAPLRIVRDVALQVEPQMYNCGTQTSKKILSDATTQTGEGPCPEPEGFFEQWNTKKYAPLSQWKLPSDKYWFPAVVSISLLQGDVIDMEWFYGILRNLKLPELRDALKKYIPQSLVDTPRKEYLSTAAFAVVSAALTYYATQKWYGQPLPFFEWDIKKAQYFPNFNRMIVWLCVLYGTTEIGKQLFIESEKNKEEL